MNREAITLRIKFTNESGAPRPKSMCDVIIERVYSFGLCGTAIGLIKQNYWF